MVDIWPDVLIGKSLIMKVALPHMVSVVCEYIRLRVVKRLSSGHVLITGYRSHTREPDENHFPRSLLVHFLVNSLLSDLMQSLIISWWMLNCNKAKD